MDVTYESIARHNLETFKWKYINHDAKEMNGNNECWIAAYFPQENANFQIACDYFMRKLYKICFQNNYYGKSHKLKKNKWRIKPNWRKNNSF